jgi:glycosyltransferase involved in cell wall biosynthesis
MLREAIQVIIPALDEEATIGAVVEGLRGLGLTRIRVVDNGSRDRTAERARAAGAEVIPETRRGYGQACWTGAQGLAEEVGWILFADADGSDELADVERLIAAAEGGADFVLGNRRARPEARAVMTPVQDIGNALATTLIWAGWGRRYYDLGPLRLVRRSVFEAARMEDRGFGWTIELQVKAAELRAKIIELPVGYGKRKGGRSKISGTIKGSVQAGAIILATIGRLFFRKMGRWRAEWAGIAGVLVLFGAWLMAPHGDFARTGTVESFLIAAAVMSAGFVVSWAWSAGSRTEEAEGGRWAVMWFWAVAAGARLLLLPMAPGDDVWRYLWEGRIQIAGYSPYEYAPAAAMAKGIVVDGGGNWQTLINHADKTAIYPPLAQLLLRVVAWADGWVLMLKLVFVAAELGTCALLARRFGHGAALVYAWNPLVIYCGAGGAHYDSVFVLAMVAGWLWSEERGVGRKTPEADGGEPAGGRAVRDGVAALWIGVSAGLKWVSAPFGAWLVWRRVVAGEWRRAGVAAGVAALPVAMGLGWFWAEFGGGGAWWPEEFVAKARGTDLAPWLVSLWLPETVGHNGWILKAFAPVAAVIFLATRRAATFGELWFTALLVFSPSNHAWYFTWVMPFAAATGNLGARLLGVSGFVYFWVWVTLGETGRWEQTVWERLWLWGPFLAGCAWSWTRVAMRAKAGTGKAR